MGSLGVTIPEEFGGSTAEVDEVEGPLLQAVRQRREVGHVPLGRVLGRGGSSPLGRPERRLVGEEWSGTWEGQPV